MTLVGPILHSNQTGHSLCGYGSLLLHQGGYTVQMSKVCVSLGSQNPKANLHFLLCGTLTIQLFVLDFILIISTPSGTFILAHNL